MRSDREDFLFQILINECLVEFAGFGSKGLAEAIKEAAKKEEINFKNDLGLNLIEQLNPLDAHERAMRQMQIALRHGIYLDKLDIADISTFLQLCGRFFSSEQTDKFNQILQDIQDKKSDENGGGANTPKTDAQKDVNERLVNLAEELLKSEDEARREYSEKFDSEVIKNYKKRLGREKIEKMRKSLKLDAINDSTCRYTMLNLRRNLNQRRSNEFKRRFYPKG